MTVSVATGQNDYYPLYLSIGNVHNSVRCAHHNALVLIGFLAQPKSTLTCIKYLPCRVIYLLYLVHISYNLFPSCCQRCTTQIVLTMCYHTQNNYFLLIYWVFQLYLLPYYTIHQGLSIHQILFPYLTYSFLYLFFFPTPMARKVSYTEIKLKRWGSVVKDVSHIQAQPLLSYLVSSWDKWDL